MQNAALWRWVLAVVTALFLSLALAVFLAGVPGWERALYDWFHRMTPVDAVPAFSTLTKLGTERFILLAGVAVLAMLPLRLLRRWWLWVAVVIAATWLEGVAKSMIGRPRPVSLRAGFPSGHTTLAAAFYFLLAYLAGTTFNRKRWHLAVWILAALTVTSVALSRVVLQAHWPLDTLGGAALGMALVAAAAWWHEAHPGGAQPFAVRSRAWIAWLDQRKEVVTIPFYGVLFLLPPFVDEDSLLDEVFDIGGLAVIVAGVLLRMWALGQPGLVRIAEERSSAPVTSGPYAYVRHPVYIANGLVGVGVGLIAENALALLILPAITCLLYRLIVPAEEAQLRDRFGTAYANYCARVPRWVPTRVSLTSWSPPRLTWIALRRDYRAVLTTAFLSVGAEISEFLPHLLQ